MLEILRDTRQFNYGMKFMKGCRVLMSDGWSHGFDLQSVPDEVIKSIRESIKLWDAALQKRNEEIIKIRQEEIERLKAQYDELVGDNKECVVPNPNYIKYGFCLCMNDGDGGLVIDE